MQIGTFTQPGPEEERYVIYFSQIKWIVLSVIYLRTERLIGLITFLWGQLGVMTMIWLKNMDESEKMFGGDLFRYLTYIQIFGWGTQFVGHGIFERRAPALLTNFLFMYIAPFFWTFELMNKLFGYRQEDVDASVAIVESDIAFYRDKKGIK